MKIERVKTTDAEEITELTIRSKDFWGYGKKQMEEWREELTITPKYINENQVFKITKDESLIGFYAYSPMNPNIVKLNFLFVEPNFIGKGYGKILMNHFLNRIENDNFKIATLNADPNAEKFYKNFGFEIVGKLDSSIQDRFLPIMEKRVIDSKE